MATMVKSFAIQGIEGYNVDIETKMFGDLGVRHP